MRGEWLFDPSRFAKEALGVRPDPWQDTVLRSTSRRMLLNCSRQAGKSTVTSILGLHHALSRPGSVSLLVSPSDRQSAELFRKVVGYLERVPNAPRRTEDSARSLQLANGSRVLALPSSADTIRGFTPSLVIGDEAAFFESDAVYAAVRPMLIVSGGRLVLLSTPNGRRGFFHAAWTDESGEWERFNITADQCPRIRAEDLERERRSLPAWLFRQEYACEFVETVESYFTASSIQSALVDDGEVLW
jgi:hypothetical protein